MTLDHEYGLERCKVDRFGKDLEETVKSYSISDYYWCSKGNEFYIKDAEKFFSIIFDYCNQTFLDI